MSYINYVIKRNGERQAFSLLINFPIGPRGQMRSWASTGKRLRMLYIVNVMMAAGQPIYNRR